jgi:hypothetical protein
MRSDKLLRIARDHKGIAVVESLLLGLILLIPVIWMLGVLSALHRSALAAAAAVRDAGSQVSSAEGVSEVERRISSSVDEAFKAHDLDPALTRVSWSGVLERGGAVDIRVAYPVEVFQMPFLDAAAGPAIWVEAIHHAPIQRYLSRD